MMEERKPFDGGSKIISMVIKILTLVIFLGYIMMWIMMPTSTYGLNLSPKIRAETDSTFFGIQGSTILIYTFPILFISVLGCLYLHFQKKNTQNFIQGIDRQHRFEKWKGPVSIKFLGIVSWTEIAFLSMFTLLLLWYFSAYFHFFLKRRAEFFASRHEKVWETKLEILGLVLGLGGDICLTFLFFPVTRCSSILPMIGLTSEASIKYHIWLGHATMALFTAHGVAYVVYWAATHQLSEMLKWQHTSISNVAGELSLLFGLVLWVATYPGIRRKMFELFFYTHYLYILFIIFFVLHVGISFSCIMLPGFYLFLVDRCLRFLQSRQSVRLISARVLPCETVELNFCKSPGLLYTPTSIIFTNVPSISRLQWHPFTISSSSNLEPEILSVIIKTEGNWTMKLYQMLSSASPVARLKVSIEGPYGPSSTHFLRHDKLVMISGGSGISVFTSIIRELIFAGKTLKCKVPKVLLVTAFKTSSDLTMLDLLFPISGVPSGFSNLELDIEAYVTREKAPSTENQKRIETIIFNPNISDAPIYPILGQNNWLWLGAIISSAFIIFLLLIGILGRYYIYPIDHNTYKIYSYSSRAVLNMLLVCISISMMAIVVFLWNKKQFVMEAKQIQGIGGPTILVEANSRFDSIDREIESLPRESLAKPCKLHYGHRPDLRRILSECNGSSVGVLVCGPKSMRHDVATICASGLSDNLHFECISFSW